MAVMRAVLVVVAVFGLVVVAAPQPAVASCAGPVSLEFALDDWGVEGVYEQRSIAWVPDLLFRSAMSVSVVERYWGVPPDPVLETHGGVGLSDTFLYQHGGCDRGARPLGDTSVSVTPGNVEVSSRGVLPEADLSARFGPPVVAGADLHDYFAAYSMVLWWPLVLLVAVAALVVLERRAGSPRATYRPNMVIIQLVNLGILAGGLAYLVSPDTGLFVWSLVGVVVVAIGLAWLSRLAVTVVGAVLVGYALVASVFSNSDGFSFIGGLTSMILGTGALVWTGYHSLRWPASFAVVGGSWLISGDWRAASIAAVAVAVLQWTGNMVIRRRYRVTQPTPDLTNVG